jgi:hypothetical protein
LARCAGISRSALFAALAKAGFRREPGRFGEVLREFPGLGRSPHGPAHWAVLDFVSPLCPEPSECSDAPPKEMFAPTEGHCQKPTPEEVAIGEFFGDDPFCCVPDFLVEDAREFWLAKNRCS